MPEPAQNYAEYQDSAPELVGQVPQAAESVTKTDGELDSSGVLSAEKTGRKGFLGPVPIIALGLLAVLVLVGIIVGAVLGTQHKEHNRMSSIYSLGVC
jgi:hypothetical protein